MTIYYLRDMTQTHRRQPRDQVSTRSSIEQREATSKSSGARYGAVQWASASSCRRNTAMWGCNDSSMIIHPIVTRSEYCHCSKNAVKVWLYALLCLKCTLRRGWLYMVWLGDARRHVTLVTWPMAEAQMAVWHSDTWKPLIPTLRSDVSSSSPYPIRRWLE